VDNRRVVHCPMCGHPMRDGDKCFYCSDANCESRLRDVVRRAEQEWQVEQRAWKRQRRTTAEKSDAPPMQNSAYRSFEEEIHERARIADAEQREIFASWGILEDAQRISRKWQRILTWSAVVLPGAVHWLLRGFWAGAICLFVVCSLYGWHVAVGLIAHVAVVWHTNHLVRTWRPREY